MIHVDYNTTEFKTFLRALYDERLPEEAMGLCDLAKLYLCADQYDSSLVRTLAIQGTENVFWSNDLLSIKPICRAIRLVCEGTPARHDALRMLYITKLGYRTQDYTSTPFMELCKEFPEVLFDLVEHLCSPQHEASFDTSEASSDDYDDW